MSVDAHTRFGEPESARHTFVSTPVTPFVPLITAAGSRRPAAVAHGPYALVPLLAQRGMG